MSGLPSKKRFEMARELMRAFPGVVVRNSSNSAASVRERWVAATASESATASGDGVGRPWPAMTAAVLAIQAVRANTMALRLFVMLIVPSLSCSDTSGSI
jgi:hypothetical protein